MAVLKARVTDDELVALKMPWQNFLEWKTYLEFVQAYFENRGIAKPIVVEIGIHTGAQRAHYERFLDAAYLGIDISDALSKPDILGNSHASETMGKLKAILGARKINLLFIDACHTYADALAEYDAYGPLVSDIIAFHDVMSHEPLARLWKDIQNREKTNPHIVFMTIGAWYIEAYRFGIGLVIKRSAMHSMSELPCSGGD